MLLEKKLQKILIVTDSYYPLVNGVVRTLTSMSKHLNGFNVSFLEPSKYKTVSCLGYNEIKLATNIWKTSKFIKKEKPEYIHIATEGPIGLSAKLYCDWNGIPYTTSYHTMFPEYINKMYGIPTNLTYSYFKWFHHNSKAVLTTTDTMKTLLESKGFKRVKSWTRGIDVQTFKPSDEDVFKDLKRPIYSYIGRVSIEKGIDDFLQLPLTGTKVVIGEGPYLEECKYRYRNKKNIKYFGYKHGEELAKYYSSSDVFVFPSKTDTFGLVMIESLSCGTPVAAYNVQGPKDIIIDGYNGSLSDVLSIGGLYISIIKAESIDRNDCINSSKKYTWEECANIFRETLVRIKK